MRLIGELDNEKQATLFTSFLLVNGIESRFDQEPGQKFEIWVKDEDQFNEARKEFHSFVENPNDSKYSNAVQKAKILSRAEEKRRKNLQRKVVRPNSSGQLPKRRPLTIIMIAICGIVALMTNFGEIGFDETKGEIRPDAQIYRVLQFNYAGPPQSAELLMKLKENPDDLGMRLASIKRGEVWRLVTTIFIHLSAFHLLFNMIWFYQFGSLLEHRYGTLFFAILVFATAAISGLFQDCVPQWMQGSVPGYLSDTQIFISGGGGMSGVIYGLFGFAWMKSVYDRRCGFRLPQSTVIILVGWLFFCMIPQEMRSGIYGGNVGNWAHGIGLLVGMAFGYFSPRK